MHRDLSDEQRANLGLLAALSASSLHHKGQSLAIAREAWINAFNRAAEELDGGKDDTPEA